MDEKINLRFADQAPVVVPVAGEEGTEAQASRTVRGYACVFGSVSEDMGFREVLAPGCITQETIDRSTILARFNHDDGKVLAKCDRGAGSLKLTVDDKGLAYEFEAPRTPAGDECLEMISRGDVSQSSFAFTIARDQWRYANGEYICTILEVDQLYDVAPVFNPAYRATTCSRHRDVIDLAEKRRTAWETIMDSYADCQVAQGVRNQYAEMQTIISRAIGEVRELTADERARVEQCTAVMQSYVDLQDQIEEEARAKENVTETKKEEKMKNPVKRNIALLTAIRAVCNGQEMDPVSRALIEEGRRQMGSLPTSGQIVIPVMERGIDVTTEGGDVVGVEVANILQPLYGKRVLGQAGAKFMTGLVGDFKYPAMNPSSVTWEGETSVPTSGAEGGFTSQTLSPKRLTAFIEVSKKFIEQNSEDVADIIMNDLINALLAKLETTVLGTGAGSTTQPAGIFNGVATTITDFLGVCNLEAGVEDANVLGECKYIISNKAKAVLRNMAKSAKSTQLVMEDGEIDGTEVFNTSCVAGNGVAYGDFGNLVIGQWGGLDVTVDPYTLATSGQIRIVINAFMDAKVVRANSIAVATV